MKVCVSCIKGRFHHLVDKEGRKRQVMLWLVLQERIENEWKRCLRVNCVEVHGNVSISLGLPHACVKKLEHAVAVGMCQR